VVLLRPDAVEAVRTRHARGGGKPADGAFDGAEHVVEHPSNRALARLTVYTNDRSPAQTRDAILSLLGFGARP
jgi:hypothetical protein